MVVKNCNNCQEFGLFFEQSFCAMKSSRLHLKQVTDTQTPAYEKLKVR